MTFPVPEGSMFSCCLVRTFQLPSCWVVAGMLQSLARW